MFIRRKRNYYYLVESVRVDGKPRQKVLAYLGRHPTLAEAREHHVNAEWYWLAKSSDDIDEALYEMDQREYHAQKAAELGALMNRWRREKGS